MAHHSWGGEYDEFDENGELDDNGRLCVACEDGDIEGARRLMTQGANPRARESLALRLAAESGRTECVKMLVTITSPREKKSEALANAATNGHVECARLLLPVSNAAENESLALRMAARHGHAECVALLIPFSNAQPEARRLCSGRSWAATPSASGF